MTDGNRARRTRRLGDRSGRQPERTVLSWDRTALTLLVNGALLLFRVNHSGELLGWVPAGLALAAALACAVLGRVRHHHTVGTETASVRANTGALVAVTVMVVTLGLTTVLFALPEV